MQSVYVATVRNEDGSTYTQSGVYSSQKAARDAANDKYGRSNVISVRKYK